MNEAAPVRTIEGPLVLDSAPFFRFFAMKADEPTSAGLRPPRTGWSGGRRKPGADPLSRTGDRSRFSSRISGDFDLERCRRGAATLQRLSWRACCFGRLDEMTTNEPTRRFPRVAVRGTVRALLRRVSEPDTLPVTLREVSEGGLCVIMPGTAPDNGARVTVEMALWRQMLYLPANVVWSKAGSGSATCGLKLHLEVTDAQTRRAFAGWVRNQAAPERVITGKTPPPPPAPAKVMGVLHESVAKPRPKPAPERPYEIDLTEMDTSVTGGEEKPIEVQNDDKTRGQDLFDWLFRRNQ
jgi:hypothetical protein